MDILYDWLKPLAVSHVAPLTVYRDRGYPITFLIPRVDQVPPKSLRNYDPSEVF
jgi:hypothetical protein